MVRSELREHIFKMLFQIEFNDAQDMPERLKNYFELLEDAADKDKEYIQKKYEAVAAKVPEIDSLLNESAKGWRTARMNKVDLTVLRLAVYEMKWDEDIPVEVAINEAVKLAKRFGGENSSSFVNGVLGKIARQES
ncbi:MAG TPA: transcription antitermination factor NusB [Candidatus Mediterraneibacter merdavium]|mgnify:FL=1|nr:transcription antitermination factor NusB [Candidatus Mediterraneibacter merdavium]